jgi:hypothetical protein
MLPLLRSHLLLVLLYSCRQLPLDSGQLAPQRRLSLADFSCFALRGGQLRLQGLHLGAGLCHGCCYTLRHAQGHLMALRQGALQVQDLLLQGSAGGLQRSQKRGSMPKGCSVKWMQHATE